jgi:hypothetical protein
MGQPKCNMVTIDIRNDVVMYFAAMAILCRTKPRATRPILRKAKCRAANPFFSCRLIFNLSDEWRVGGLQGYVEAEASEQGTGGRFDVDAPRAREDAGFYRVGAVAAAAPATHGKLDAAQSGPAALWFVELPLMNDFRIQRSRRENRAVGVDRLAGRGVNCFHGAEVAEQAGSFGLHGVISIVVSGDGVMHAGVLQRQGNRRNEIQEVKGIDGDENGGDASTNCPASDNVVLAGDGLQQAQKKIQQCQAQRSAEQKDEPPNGMQHDGQDINHEAEQRQEKETELEGKARVVRLQPFIGRKGRAEDQEERPTGPQAAAAKIEYKKCAEQPAKSELQRVDEPEVRPGRVRGIAIAAFRALECFRTIEVFRTIDEQDARGNHREVRDDPEIFPERIDALERYGVKGKSPKQRDRGKGSFQASIGRTKLDAHSLASHFERHGPSENIMLWQIPASLAVNEFLARRDPTGRVAHPLKGSNADRKLHSKGISK